MDKFDYNNLSEGVRQKVIEGIASSKIPFFLMEDGKMAFANEAWLNFSGDFHKDLESGLSIEKCLWNEYKRLKPHSSDADRVAYANKFADIMMNGKDGDYISEDGRLFRGFYDRSDSGFVTGISFDMSDLQAQRLAAKNTRELLETTLDGLQHGVLLYGLDGKVIYANKVLKAWTTESGSSITEGMSQTNITSQLQESIKNALRNIESDTDFEFIQTVEDGRTFLIESRLIEGTGKLISAVDISELEQKREEAKKIHETLESLLEGLPHGVMLVGFDGNIVYCNETIQASTQDFGAQIEVGKNISELRAVVPHQDPNNQGDMFQDFEYTQSGANGTSYLIRRKILENIGVLVSTVDVTDFQDALEAAKAADKAKTSFLANMSHEIRTPMNGVLGMAQVLEQMDIDDDQKNCIRIIKQSSEMLLNIINDILDISKLDAEKIELEEDAFDLNSVIRSTVELVRPQTSTKGLDLILDMPDFKHNFLGDKGRLRQIVLNLLSNAIKFTHSGYIKISAHMDHELHFEIQDTGIGIEPEKIQKIFDRFEQSDNSTTREYGGTGLGLSISKKLVGLMGGTISVQSEPGTGSIFKVLLPLKTTQKSDSDTELVSYRSFEGTPILVIDDLPVNHMVMANQLKPLKLNPFFVDGADKGLNTIRKMAKKGYKIPLVICDYKMPGKTGFDFVKELREDPEISDTPVIIVSSADIISRKKEFSAYGVSDVFEKPCNPTDLLKSVSKALSHRTPDEKSIVAPSPSSPKPSIRADKHILVADDDPVNRQVFKGLLKMFGYSFVIVENGLEALKAYSEEDFDLVIMDISMPVLNGLEATRKIIAYETRNNLAHTPVIAVTAHAMKGNKEEFLTAGMDDHLAKPILRADFEIMLNKWLSRDIRPAKQPLQQAI